MANDMDDIGVLVALSKLDPSDSPIMQAIAAVAEQKVLNARLKAENAHLKQRIAEEDARLSHA